MVFVAAGSGTDSGVDNKAVLNGTPVCTANKGSNTCSRKTAGDGRVDETDVLHHATNINKSEETGI